MNTIGFNLAKDYVFSCVNTVQNPFHQKRKQKFLFSMDASIEKTPSSDASASLNGTPSEPNSEAFDLKGMNELRLFFLRQRSTCKGQKGKVQRAIQTVVVALAAVLAATYFLSENLHGSTVASFSLALLVCLVAAIALWSSEANEEVLYDRYCESQSIEAIETFCEAEKKMLVNDDSGWHTLEMRPTATVMEPVKDSALDQNPKHTHRKGLTDALQIAVMSAFSLLLTFLLTRTGPDLELALQKPMATETTQQPTKVDPDTLQIVGFSE